MKGLTVILFMPCLWAEIAAAEGRSYQNCKIRVENLRKNDTARGGEEKKNARIHSENPMPRGLVCGLARETL